MNRTLYIAVALGLSVSLAGSGDRPRPEATVEDTRLTDCFAGDDNIVREAFTVPAGQDYRDVLPAMGYSPELEGASGAYLVVFDGEFRLPPMSGIPGQERPTTAEGVVCVLLPSGERIVYANVSLEGMKVP